jgi:glycosyltransferase involved in cell wall biosynthesis
MKIFSPMATGNGAYIVHKELEKRISGYLLRGYHPYLTLMPFCLRAAANINKADLIHTTPDYACFFMKPGIPSILTFHNYVLDSWMRQYSTRLQWIHYKTDLRLFTKLAVASSHTLTAVSRYTADLAKTDLGISRDIQVIYNGIDSTRFIPVPQKERRTIQVLFSGNPTLRKGAHWLPDIAKRLNKHIRIYYTSGLRNSGSIPGRSNLIPVGSIPYTDMPAFYNTMDIVLMPTVREGFSLAVLEAMSCGLPVVASNCCSLPEQVVEGKGGYLCPVGDVDSFAERLNYLADSSGLRLEMGEFNRAKVEKEFTMGKMINEYQRLFEEAMRR